MCSSHRAIGIAQTITYFESHFSQTMISPATAASSKWALLLGARSLVACNIYISAGRKDSADFVLNLLRGAQKEAASLRSSQKIAVIHAYVDGPYNRSSFHIAGSPCSVAKLASSIASGAIEGLEKASQNPPQQQNLPGEDDEENKHPYVGLVDHISILPLWNIRQNEHGPVAREVGEVLSKIGVEVFYYGEAHPEKMPLAEVRRMKTNFFKSGGLDQSSRTNPDTASLDAKGIATVGAPPTFVENFNIRLTSHCSRKTARSLTKKLRERDGGLVGVEALTLPYSAGRFEVACNLLRPDLGSAEAVEERLKEWAKELERDEKFQGKSYGEIVEKAYRVGTNAEQCLDVLTLADEAENRRHDQKLLEQVNSYFV